MNLMNSIIFQSIRFGIGKTEYFNNNVDLAEDVLKGLYKLSKKHDMAHLVGDSFDKNGLLPKDSEVSKKFLQERNMAIYRYEQINYELEEICRVLEEEKIEHIPLKGAVIRKYYPEPWMRTSCDIDIYVHKEDIAKALDVLAEKLHYSYSGKCAHDEQMYSESGVHLELHHELIEDYIAKKANAVLNEVWERSHPAAGWQYRKEMTDEMFYFYHILHMAKHFKSGGCGIKPFMDIWILNHKLPDNKQKRDELLARGEFLTFADAAQNLSEVWFSGKEENETDRLMQNYVLEGGVYGTTENHVALKQAKKGGRFRFVMSRVFQPYDEIKHSYPVLKKHKWLTPIFEVVRWFRILFKGRAKHSLHELKTNAAITQEEQQNMTELVQRLGL